MLNKRIQDLSKIKELEEKLFIIKKENTINTEKLITQLTECQQALERRDCLVNANSELRENYQKANKEIKSLKDALEQAQLKSEKHLKTIEQLYDDIKIKERNVYFLTLHNKDIQNELIKYSEIYKFNLSQNILRSNSISAYNADDIQIIKSKKKLNLLNNIKRSFGNYEKKINENIHFFTCDNNNNSNSNIYLEKSLHSIFENGVHNENDSNDNSENEIEKSLCILDYKDYEHKKSLNLKKEVVHEINCNEQSTENIINTPISNKVDCFDRILVNSKNNKQNYFVDFHNDDNIQLNPVEFSAIDYNSKSKENEEQSKFLNNLPQNEYNNENKNNINNIYCDENNEIFNSSNNILSKKAINSSMFRSSNYLLNKRISLKDIIDSNLDEFEMSKLSRRQSIMNFIGEFSQPNYTKMNNYNKNDITNILSNEINTSNSNVESYSYSNNKNLEISNTSLEITKEHLNTKFFNKKKSDKIEKSLNTQIVEDSEAIVIKLKEKLDNLTLKNIELQSILANEKFEKESEIKIQQMKIEKLNSALIDLKKKVKCKL